MRVSQISFKKVPYTLGLYARYAPASITMISSHAPLHALQLPFMLLRISHLILRARWVRWARRLRARVSRVCRSRLRNFSNPGSHFLFLKFLNKGRHRTLPREWRFVGSGTAFWAIFVFPCFPQDRSAPEERSAPRGRSDRSALRCRPLLRNFKNKK